MNPGSSPRIEVTPIRVTGSWWATSALSKSQFVNLRNVGHSPLERAGPCATDLMRPFFATPGRVDASCAEPPMTFDIPATSGSVVRSGTGIDPRHRMTRPMTEYERQLGLGPWWSNR